MIRGGCSPVIARLPRAWNDPAYRRARRRGRAIAALTPGTGRRAARSPAPRRVRRGSRTSCRPTRSRPAPRSRGPDDDRPTPMTAALLQLADHAERLAVLDDREAGHFRAISDG